MKKNEKMLVGDLGKSEITCRFVTKKSGFYGEAFP